MAKVLVLEQSKSVRNNLRERLEFEGYSTEGADGAESAAGLCSRVPFDIILTDDVRAVPDADTPFIVISSTGTIDSAVEAIRSGAADFLTKPIDMNRLLSALRRIITTNAETAESGNRAESMPHRATTRAKRTTSPQTAIEPIVGASEEISHVRELIEKVAPSEARVLITGENGTGKELVARWLHAKSRRAAAPFVEVNCAAIPSELIESELFGHERGAFTSAVKQRKGKFEQADSGTLFMDEIGDMSLSAQAKVLRALQEHKISRVGSDRDIEVDVRVIAATNKNLPEVIAKGNFREDLYHRIGVIIIKVPPLRTRRGDVPVLINHFIGRICEEHNIPRKPIEAEAVEQLSKMRWSGNIRELRNVIERLIILSGERITLGDIRMYC
jgi:DNA-binding NtrC family response regulator